MPAVLPNAWLGVSAESQRWARVRLPLLADTPAVVRFASCEPLLGALDIRPWLGGGLDWVIAGGESGPKARPMHPDWARSLRNQCQAAGVAFFFKQWGAWRPAEAADAAHRRTPVALDGPVDGDHVGAAAMVRVGKTAAGRLLDGRMWDEFPRPFAKACVGGG
jgi:protein gp37